MIKCLISIFLVLFAMSAIADDYLVNFEVSDSQGVVASPSMLLAEGAEGILSLGERLKCSVIVFSQSDTTAHVQMSLSRNGEEQSPRLQVNLGESSAVSIGDLRVALTVEHVDI